MVPIKMKKHLNIAFIVNEFPCISEMFILNQIIGLLDLGCRVHIFALNKATDCQMQHEAIAKYDLLNKIRYFPSIPEKRLSRLVKFLSVTARHIFRHPKWILRCLDFRKYEVHEALNHLFRSEPLIDGNYDVIHCQYGVIGKDWIYLKEIMKVKMVTSFRGYDLEKFVHDNQPSVYEELFKKGDAFLPVCVYFSNKLRDLNCSEERIHVLRSGINVSEYQYRERAFDFQKKIEILSVGRLVEKKGFKYAIYAIEKLVKKYPNIQYTIVGEGALELELKLLVQSLKLENNIHFIKGMVNGELKEAYYQAQIFILPCVQASDRDQEGIPNVLKEAMATGLPVVSTWHSGIPELVEHGISGFLVPEGDVEGIVKNCEHLISHPQRCAEMGQAGRRFVEENFEISKLNQRLVGFYEQSLRALPKANSEVMQ